MGLKSKGGLRFDFARCAQRERSGFELAQYPARRSIDSTPPARYRARMPKSPAQPAPEPDEPNAVAQFEQSLDELEQVVAKMEGGELNLDESLRSFERGITQYRNCQAALEQAEARVKLLLDPEHPESASPFASPAER